jgi:hypothetical protein
LAVLGEGCQARPELNSSGLFLISCSLNTKNTPAENGSSLDAAERLPLVLNFNL